ncbi:MAG: hypothetical protein B6U76_09830 [Desulfurococcales archaeon ex4484_217_2]|nr:MAG: hypothetical protein B6U76_09830 [Desulfurococcales archaeon ex4484_217_2]
MMPLAYARNGALVRVVGIKAGKGLCRRLHELGIIEGKMLRVVKSQGPGPVIIEVVGDSSPNACRKHPSFFNRGVVGGRLLLGFGVAKKIMVEEVLAP